MRKPPFARQTAKLTIAFRNFREADLVGTFASGVGDDGKTAIAYIALCSAHGAKSTVSQNLTIECSLGVDRREVIFHSLHLELAWTRWPTCLSPMPAKTAKQPSESCTDWRSKAFGLVGPGSPCRVGFCCRDRTSGYRSTAGHRLLVCNVTGVEVGPRRSCVRTRQR